MKHLFVAPLLALLPITGCATEVIPFGHEASWQERQYRTTLPAPFGGVQITIAADNSGKTTLVRIHTDVGEVGKATPAKISAFAVHVEFGELVYSEKYKESFRSIAGWRVDESMTVQNFEVVNFQ